MKDFKVWIKTRLLLSVGSTYKKYTNRAKKNADGYDPVDRLILMAAYQLPEREVKIFGLLYDGKPMKTVLRAMRSRNKKPPQEATLIRYRNDARKRILDAFKSPELKALLRKAVETEQKVK